VDLYNVVHEWEVRERERDLYPHPINETTHFLLMNVGILKYYEEATSLKGHSGLLVHLIHVRKTRSLRNKIKQMWR
jgi:hypothetical protein